MRRDDAPRVRSPLFAESMTVVAVGPADLRPSRVVCFDCGGAEWVEDRAFDWKDGAARVRNALTLKCVACGRRRRPA